MNKSEMLNFLDKKFRNCNPEFLKLSQVYFENEDGDTFRAFIQHIGKTIGADWVVKVAALNLYSILRNLKTMCSKFPILVLHL